MKKSLFTLVVCLMLVPCSAIAEDNHNGVKAGDAVIFNGGRPHKLIEVQPEGWYYHDTRMLTIEFPSTGFVPYTLSISSELPASVWPNGTYLVSVINGSTIVRTVQLMKQ